MRDFESSVVFIPGGSTGIGLAAAKRLAARGAHVAIFARREGQLAAAAAAIAQQRRHDVQRVVWRQLDVTDAVQVHSVLAATIVEVGAPDVLINCVGRAIPEYFERISVEQLDETMRINLYGCWHATRALLPHMRDRGGYIVNVASLAGLIGVFGYADYAAAKFAVVGLSEVLRSELAPHRIAVSVLCPPDTDTPGFARENTSKPAETRAVSAGAGMLSPEQVVDALLAGMAKRAFLIIPGREARLSHLIKRLFPGVAQRLMDRQVRRVRCDAQNPVGF